MKIALLVEGPSDKEAFPILVKKILGEGTSVIPRVLRGRGNVLNAQKVCSVAQFLLQRSPDVSKIIVCVDSECTPADQTEREIGEIEKLVNARIQGCPVRYIAVIHALEGWLLADAHAITEYLGRGAKAKIPKRAASNCRPKEVMKQVFRKASKGYLAPRDAPQIAEKIDIDKIVDRNRSFAHFRELVADP